MSNEPKNPLDRDDGKPWVPWGTAHDMARILPGHKERVELSAWYDRERQSLVVTLTQYDEQNGEWSPGWAQLNLVDVGPFMARGDLGCLAEIFVETVIDVMDLPRPPG